MKRSTIFSAILSVVLMGGCGNLNNSFNSYQFPQPQYDSIDSWYKLAQTKSSTDKTITINPTEPPEADKCASFVFPVIGPAPELPMKEIVAANGNVGLIQRIELKHIDELRLFISTTRKQQSQAREDYQKLCGNAK